MASLLTAKFPGGWVTKYRVVDHCTKAKTIIYWRTIKEYYVAILCSNMFIAVFQYVYLFLCILMLL